MRFYLCIFMTMLCIGIYAKNKPKEKPKRKPYFKLSYEVIQRVPFFEHPFASQMPMRHSLFSYLNFPISFGFFSKNTKSFHEFSLLSRLSFLQIPYNRNMMINYNGQLTIERMSTNARFANIGLRYEFNYKIIGKRNSKSNFYIGFPFEIYYAYEMLPFNSFQPFKSNSIGFSIGITPHYQYNFAKRFHIDIAIPLTIYDGLVQFSELDNPNIPTRKKNLPTAYYSYKGTTIATFRVGIGVCF